MTKRPKSPTHRGSRAPATPSTDRLNPWIENIESESDAHRVIAQRRRMAPEMTRDEKQCAYILDYLRMSAGAAGMEASRTYSPHLAFHSRVLSDFVDAITRTGHHPLIDYALSIRGRGAPRPSLDLQRIRKSVAFTAKALMHCSDVKTNGQAYDLASEMATEAELPGEYAPDTIRKWVDFLPLKEQRVAKESGQYLSLKELRAELMPWLREIGCASYLVL
jgi:hypothetical protein